MLFNSKLAQNRGSSKRRALARLRFFSAGREALRKGPPCTSPTLVPSCAFHIQLPGNWYNKLLVMPSWSSGLLYFGVSQLFPVYLLLKVRRIDGRNMKLLLVPDPLNWIVPHLWNWPRLLEITMLLFSWQHWMLVLAVWCVGSLILNGILWLEAGIRDLSLMGWRLLLELWISMMAKLFSKRYALILQNHYYHYTLEANYLGCTDSSCFKPHPSFSCSLPPLDHTPNWTPSPWDTTSLGETW